MYTSSFGKLKLATELDFFKPEKGPIFIEEKTCAGFQGDHISLWAKGAVHFSTRILQCKNFISSSLNGIFFHGINHMVLDYR